MTTHHKKYYELEGVYKSNLRKQLVLELFVISYTCTHTPKHVARDNIVIQLPVRYARLLSLILPTCRQNTKKPWPIGHIIIMCYLSLYMQVMKLVILTMATSHFYNVQGNASGVKYE